MRQERACGGGCAGPWARRLLQLLLEQLAKDLWLGCLEPAVVAARGVAHKCPNRGPGAGECLREMAADEAAGPRYEDAATAQRFLFWTRRRH